MQKKTLLASIRNKHQGNEMLDGVLSSPEDALAPPMTSTLIRGAANYNERLAVFNMMEQLDHLCRAVQRHRGFSMGLLAGNTSFSDDFHQLQEQMSRRIQLISAFATRTPLLLTHTELERLHYAWNTIRDNWQDDSVLENFEFHSHFVDQILVLMVRLTEKIRLPYVKKLRQLIDNQPVDVEVNSTYQSLLNFSHRRLPRFIEILGKIRALSVHSAAMGRCEPGSEKKLQYLLQCIEQEREKLFDSANILLAPIGSQLPSLLTIKTYEYKLDFLVDKISNDILNVDSIELDEEWVFNLVTGMIDVYWRVVDDSLDLLYVWQKNDLEQWLIEG